MHRRGPSLVGGHGRAEDVAVHDQLGRLQAQWVEQLAARPQGRRHEHGVALDDLPALQPDPDQPVVGDLQAGDDAADQPDTAGRQPGDLGRLGVGLAVEEDHEVLAPLPDQRGLVHRHRPAGEHGEALPGDLVPVAVGAVQDVPSEPLGQAVDLGQHVGDPAGQDDSACADGPGVVADLEPGTVGVLPRRDAGHPAVDDRGAVAGRLGPTLRQELGRRDALVAQQVVDPLGRRVAGLAGVDDDDVTAGAGQADGGAQPRRPTTHDHDVDLLSVLTHVHPPAFPVRLRATR